MLRQNRVALSVAVVVGLAGIWVASGRFSGAKPGIAGCSDSQPFGHSSSLATQAGSSSSVDSGRRLVYPEVMAQAKTLSGTRGGSLTVTNDMDEACKDAHVIYAKSWASYKFYGCRERSRPGIALA